MIQSKLKVYCIDIGKDRMSPKVSLIQYFLHCKHGIQMFIETTFTFITNITIRLFSKTFMHKSLANKTALTLLRNVFANTY